MPPESERRDTVPLTGSGRGSASRGTVLVTDSGRGSAIACLRSLGRGGWRVVATDSSPSSVGFHSRYVAHHAVYPNPEHAPDAFVACLLGLAHEQKVDLVLPVTDAAILPLAGAAASFEGVCRLAIPEPAALRMVTDKQQTLELADRLGIPVPKTRLVTTVDEARDAIATLGFPVVLKPGVSRLYRTHAGIEAFSVSYADTRARLDLEMGRLEGRCAVLLQQYVPGVGCGVELLADRGRCLVLFQHRRLREVPFTGGASSFRESVAVDPTLREYTERLVQALGWTGLAMVEFRLGEQGAVLMEINGRVWGSLPLAVHSGVDFPNRLAELLLEGPPSPDAPVDTRYRIGLRSRNLPLDMVWIGSVLAGKRRYPFLRQPARLEAVTAFLGLFNPRYRLDVQSRDDPKPGLAELPAIVRNLSSKVKRVG